MTNIIKNYYKGLYKMAIWVLMIGILNLLFGITAFFFWGEVGLAILVILSGFGSYQIIWGAKSLYNNQTRLRQKLQKFDQTKKSFCQKEISKIESKTQVLANLKNPLLISFLIGLLCLFLGAFGTWSDLSVGAGAALALQSGIMLIVGLLFNYQSEFYLLHLRKQLNKDRH